ncbi:MAG: alpha-glucosidase [Oscillospiraceae bacterium]|nr:alpha-glucosidase [Oscillospiraceae bacterium]
MIQKYTYGAPFPTEAVIGASTPAQGDPACGEISLEDGFRFTCRLAPDDVVYGLGEANRGLNKRGYRYVNSCTDETTHSESVVSLYAAHNFVVVAGKETFGLFFDYPARILFDVGYTRMDTLTVACGHADLDLYVITGEGPYDVVRQFRKLTGPSYIPPKFAFGFGQSRWGYKTREDFRGVADGYRNNNLPLDMLYMDIDYMQDYKDFTVNGEEFPDFPAFVAEMKRRGIRLIPIIDAGVKVEAGYPVYEEGVAKGYFCKRADGSNFVAAVWPGDTHFPDVLNPEARAWFGGKYKILTDAGIEGFWNDMNEPSIFYTPELTAQTRENLEKAFQDGTYTPNMLHKQKPEARGDYELFYHNTIAGTKRHDEVHNLYGFNMTRAAGEAFSRIDPNRRFLLFSRSSYIGMHRYGGIWTGDNCSWWSHILLNLQMMASLNMCGFLYTGADLGGFGGDTTRDLLLRWLALGVFTPLMRNHTALNTRNQECYQFEDMDDFRHVLGVRYRLVPYLYSEYMKAALNDDLIFKPLSFVYPEDKMSAQVEDQLMLGSEVMIAPVYTQNAKGRYVYLPEEMQFIKFLPCGELRCEILAPGHHYVEIALNEVPLFIRKGKCIPLAGPAETVDSLDTEHLTMVGYPGGYELYDDDGVHKDYGNPKNYRTLRKD